MKLYGLDASQPFRSVKWLLLMKNMQFEEIFVSPGSRKKNGSQNEEYLSKSIAGTVPLLEETDGNKLVYIIF